MSKGIASRKYTFDQVASTGWSLFWKNIGSFVPIVLFVYVPINIAISFVPIEPFLDLADDRGPRLYVRVIGFIQFVFGVLATMSFAAIIEASIYGEPISGRQALRHAYSRWGACVAARFYAHIIVLLMTLLLIVPGIIWWLYYYFVVYAVGLRGLPDKKALNYSKALVKGQWWRVFGYILGLNIISLLIALIATTPFDLAPDTRFFEVLSDTIYDIVQVPFLAMEIVLFLNLDYLSRYAEQEPEGEFGEEDEENLGPDLIDAGVVDNPDDEAR